MGRRARGTLPQMRLHKRSGTVRVRVGSKEFSLGKFGDPETHKRYARFIVDYMRQDHLLPDDPEITPLQVPPKPPAGDQPAPDRTHVPAPQIPPADHVPEGITVMEVCSQYLKYAEDTYRTPAGKPTGTLFNVRMAIRALEEYLDLPADGFGPLALQRLMQSMARRPSRRKGPDGKPRSLSRGTVNQTIKSIRRMFRWAAGMQLLPASVPDALAHVDLIRAGRTALVEPVKVQPVADETIQLTLPHLPSIVADMVMVQRFTGCRPGEICGMKPGEIDRSTDVWVWQPAAHKTAYCGKVRRICIGPKAQKILTPYLEGRSPDAPCFSATESEQERNAARRRGRKSPMTPSHKARRERARRRSRKQKPYRRDSYAQAIERACGKADVFVWHPHQLRHRAGAEARNERGLDAAQARLGHSHAKTTEIYAQLTLEKAMQIARELG